MPIDGRCYYFGNKTSTQSQAQNDCRARGGDLAVPENLDMNEKMYQIMKSRNITSAWIGVHKDVSGKFITVSGVEVSFTNWYSGEPNNGGNVEECVELMHIALWRNDNHNVVAGQWNDAPCSFSDRYHICELKHQA